MVKCSNHYRTVGTDSEHSGRGRHGISGGKVGESPEAGAHLAHHAASLHLLRYSPNNSHSKRRPVIAAFCSIPRARVFAVRVLSHLTTLAQ